MLAIIALGGMAYLFFNKDNSFTPEVYTQQQLTTSIQNLQQGITPVVPTPIIQNVIPTGNTSATSNISVPVSPLSTAIATTLTLPSNLTNVIGITQPTQTANSLINNLGTTTTLVGQNLLNDNTEVAVKFGASALRFTTNGELNIIKQVYFTDYPRFFLFFVNKSMWPLSSQGQRPIMQTYPDLKVPSGYVSKFDAITNKFILIENKPKVIPTTPIIYATNTSSGTSNTSSGSSSTYTQQQLTTSIQNLQQGITPVVPTPLAINVPNTTGVTANSLISGLGTTYKII